MFGIDMPKSSLSHHFRILRESGVIVSEGQGTVLMNRIQREELEAKFPGLIESILTAAQKKHRAPKQPGVTTPRKGDMQNSLQSKRSH